MHSQHLFDHELCPLRDILSETKMTKKYRRKRPKTFFFQQIYYLAITKNHISLCVLQLSSYIELTLFRLNCSQRNI